MIFVCKALLSPHLCHSSVLSFLLLCVHLIFKFFRLLFHLVKMQRESVISKRSVTQELEQWVKKMRCSGTTGIGIESFADIRVGVDQSEVLEDSVSYDTVTSEDIINNTEISLEAQDSLRVILPNGDSVEGCFKAGLRHGVCVVTLQEGDVAEIRGTYSEGKLAGKAKVTFRDKRTIDGFFKVGILHGFGRYFDRKGRLTFVGNHKNGRPDGTCWRIIRGGGCVVGRVDKAGSLSGIRLAYIYPDYETALVGVFKDGVMVQGQEATITGVVDDDAGVKIPIFSKPGGHLHVRQIGSYNHICSGTTIITQLVLKV